MTCRRCGCELRQTPYGLGHVVNPGVGHHYPRPRSEPLGGARAASAHARALPPSGSATGRSVPLVAPGR